MNQWMQRFKSLYQGLALSVLNVFFLLLLFNLILGIIYFVKDHSRAQALAGKGPALFTPDGAPVDTGRRLQGQLEWFDFQAYQGYGEDFVSEVLEDFYLQGLGAFMYQPWVEFAEKPFSGKRLHVDRDERGFPLRRTVNPLVKSGTNAVRIFLFGGSTTFGYQTADEHTWPSHLSKILNDKAARQDLPFHIEISNYGRGYYHPSQEVVLLMDLLKSGHRPSLVIFMDGINKGLDEDVPWYTDKMSRAFDVYQYGRKTGLKEAAESLRDLPMMRFVRGVQRRIRPAAAKQPPFRAIRGAKGRAALTEEKRVRYYFNRFEENRKIADSLCAIYGCKTLFFLQPDPRDAYDLALYRRELPESFLDSVQLTRLFYEKMRASSHYIDLSGLFHDWGKDRKAIVDDLHYSPAFHAFLAERLAGFIDLAALPVYSEALNDADATGAVRQMF